MGFFLVLVLVLETDTALGFIVVDTDTALGFLIVDTDSFFVVVLFPSRGKKEANPTIVLG